MKQLIKIFAGLVILGGTALLTLPDMIMQSWGKALISLLKGGITFLVISIGITLTLMGFSELKNN